MPSVDYTKVLDKLQEKNCKFFSFTSKPEMGDYELVRFFPTVSEELQALTMAFLDLYTCWAGYQSAHPEIACPTVTDPVAGKIEAPYTGLWRRVSNRKGVMDQVIGVYQTLRLGWASAIHWDEALILDKGFDSLTREMDIVFPNVGTDDGLLQEVADSLDDQYDDPVIRGWTWTGTIYVHSVHAQQVPEDGAGRILVHLSIDPPNVTITEHNDALSFKTSEQKHCHTRELARADLAAKVGSFAGGVPAVGTALSGSISRNEDGIWQSIFEVVQARYRSATFTTPSEFGTAASVRDAVIVIDNITDAALQDLLDLLPSQKVDANGFWHEMHYSLRPGLSPYPGLVQTHLHIAIGKIVWNYDPWNSWERNNPTPEYEEDYSNDHKWVRRRAVYTYIKQTRSLDAAYAYAYMTIADPDYFCAKGSRVDDHGQGRWKAYNVQKETSWGSWYDAATGEAGAGP